MKRVSDLAGYGIPEIFNPKEGRPLLLLAERCGSYWNLIDDPVDVKVGDRVFCTVTGCRGWYTVEAIKGPKRDLRIKISFSKQWAYGHNFTREPAEWMLK